MQEKLPEWLKHSEDYTPVKTGGAFIEKSIASIGGVMTKIKLQNGHEKGRSLPALLKLFLAFGLIAFLSLTHEKMWILGVVSVIQLYLCMWPARDIATILKASLWATLLAFLFPPALAIIDVAHVPIFWPNIIGIVDENVIIPVVDIACKIPTVAAELCTIAVTTAPAKTPKIGLDILLSTSLNTGKLLNELAIFTIVIIPVNNNPKLKTICPISLYFDFSAF